MAYITLCYVRVFAIARPSVVCLSVMFVHPTQPVQIFGNVLCQFVAKPYANLPAKFYGDRPRETHLSRIKRGRGAKYSVGKHVEGYITETVQDMASGTIMTNRKSYR